MIETANLNLEVCKIPHLEALLAGEAAFKEQFQLQVIDGYIEFPGALEWMLKQLQAGADPAWGSYLIIHRADRALIGLGGFKGAPDEEGMVEIGYGTAPEYRGKGYATEAARGLIDHAFMQASVQKVWAHTLAEPNASTHVLRKSGVENIGSFDDPEDGPIWRWEIVKGAGVK
jgi:[ribosomal protein S5]-alanine N-acetyltransferase